MGKNLIRETFDAPGTWVCPAGVVQVRIYLFENCNAVKGGGNSSYVAQTNINNSPVAWGSNTNGQLGDGTIANKSGPIQVQGTSNQQPKLWAAGADNAMSFQGVLLWTGAGLAPTMQVYVWGLNTNGQLGDSTVVSKSSAIVLAGTAFNSLTSFRPKMFAAGTAFFLCLTSDGDVLSWGLNSSGQLGSSTITDRSSPVAIVGGLKFKKIAAGTNHSLGLVANGDCYAWGNNTLGQCGLNNTTNVSSPVLVSGSLKFTSIAAGQNISHGITLNGDCYAWGANSVGQLGDGTIIPKSSPVLVTGGLKWKKIGGTTGDFQCGIARNGQAYTWGLNSSGQLGDNSTTNRSSPVLITGGFLFSDISGGAAHVVSLNSKGVVYCWGLGTSGQLGDNTLISKSSPVSVVAVAANFQLIAISPKRLISMELMTVSPGVSYNVELLGWGNGFAGQMLGNGWGDTYLELEYEA